MKTDGLLYFIGLASLTYFWLDVNYRYFRTIANLIHDHNEYIRQKALEKFKEHIRQKALEKNENESEDESEDESENDNENE